MAINYPASARGLLNLSASAPFNFNASHTILAWIKRTSDVGANQILATATSAADDSGTNVVLAVTASDELAYDSNPSGPSPATVDSWYYMAYMQNSGVDRRIYWCNEGDTGDLTAGANGASKSDATAFNRITVGAYVGGGSEFRGSICCFRVYSGTMTQAEMKAERDNAAAQKAGYHIDWRMATAADTSPAFSAAGVIAGWGLTNSGSPTTDTDEPSNIASASSVMPGIIRPRQGIAFSSAIARHS
jgi:hypothetical protein